MKPTLSDIALLLKGSKEKKQDSMFYAKVNSLITSEGKTVGYKVSLDGTASNTIEAKKLAGANVGDVVQVTLHNGKASVTGTVGGDKDAETAQETADNVATDLDENYSTTEEVEEMIATSGNGSKIYYQDDAPTGGTYKVGDTWFDTNDGYKIYEWNGTQWSPHQFGTSAIASESIIASKIVAGAVTGDKINISTAIHTGEHESVFSTSEGAYLGTGGISYCFKEDNIPRLVFLSNPSVNSASDVLGIATWSSAYSEWTNDFGVDQDGTVESGSFFVNGNLQVADTSTFTEDVTIVGDLTLQGDINTGISDGDIYIYADTDIIMADLYSSTYSPKRRRTYFPHAYAAINSGTAAKINANGLLNISSSKRDHKTDITEEISAENDPRKIYDIPVKQFKYKPEYQDSEDYNFGKDTIGFIAEEIAEAYPLGTYYEPDGTPADWDERVITAGLVKLIQDQHTEIESLKQRVAELEVK